MITAQDILSLKVGDNIEWIVSHSMQKYTGAVVLILDHVVYAENVVPRRPLYERTSIPKSHIISVAKKATVN
jgi:hypothetical protein